MKTTRAGHFIKRILAGTLIGSVTFTCMPAKAAHEMIYAVDQFNNLFNFYSDNPAQLIDVHYITGVQSGEEIRGIDYWNGTIYGLGSSSRLYSLNPNTGAATQVGSGQFNPLLNGQTFGVDNGPAGFLITSGNGQSLLISRSTGVAIGGPALSYAAGDLLAGQTPRVDALAYDDLTGIWYAGDTLHKTLARFNPSTDLLTTIGMMGIWPSKDNGLDISPVTGIMYMATPAYELDPQANLYTVDKTNGSVTLVDQIGKPGDDILVRGLTVFCGPFYSQTNRIVSIVHNSDGSCTLNFQGTEGAQYYVVTSSNAASPMSSWTVVNTTNTAGSGGRWQSTVTRAAPTFYRGIAVNPQP